MFVPFAFISHAKRDQLFTISVIGITLTQISLVKQHGNQRRNAIYI